MQISALELNAVVLNKTIYLIHGGEALQTLEASNFLYTALKQQGFSERNSFVVRANFNLDPIFAITKSYSMFTQQQLLVLQCTTEKMPAECAEFIIDFINNANPDLRLIIVADKLSGPVQQSKWFKAIDNAGCVITAKTIPSEKFAAWISARFNAVNFKISLDTTQLLVQLYNGDPSAIKQLITQLALCFDPGPLEWDQILPFVRNNAQYNIYNLIDLALLGDLKAVCTIFQQLQQQHIEATLVLWAIAKELRLLYNLKYGILKGAQFHTVCKQYGVWATKIATYQKYLQQITLQILSDLLQSLSALDLKIKGIHSNELLWEQLFDVVLAIARRNIVNSM